MSTLGACSSNAQIPLTAIENGGGSGLSQAQVLARMQLGGNGMIVLDAATKKLQIVLAGNVAANALPFVASWVDITTTAFTPGETDGTSNNQTDVDVVAAPGASTQRVVKFLDVYNADTASATVTVKLDNNGTDRTLWKGALATLEHLIYDGTCFKVLDATGAVKVAQSGTGRWLRTSVLTSGTSFTTGSQTTSIFVRMVGGGGGGGGCTSVSSAAGAAGGGGAGGYAEKTFTVTPNTAYTYAIGAAGVGQSGAAGTNATDSTFTVGATTVTAKGGTGGPVATAATTLTARAGGAGGTVSTNGDVNGAGSPGDYGVVLIVATPIVSSGSGGSGPFGGGGVGIVAVGNGNAAAGFGAGGGGAATGASAARTGGNGTAGVIIVDEYA